jgi:protoporphyrinogen oxidase
VAHGLVFRVPHAYPVYTLGYKQNLAVVRGYVDQLAGLKTIGRNGLHRYNNMDHSMLSGINAARDLIQDLKFEQAASQPQVLAAGD